MIDPTPFLPLLLLAIGWVIRHFTTPRPLTIARGAKTICYTALFEALRR